MAKVFTFRGKTLEELKKISDKEFMELLSARPRRSLKKGFTNAQKIMLKKINLTIEGKYNKRIKTHCRDMVILPKMEGIRLAVHNGKEFTPVEIVGEMIGHKLGEFSLTRSKVVHTKAGIGATKGTKHQAKK